MKFCGPTGAGVLSGTGLGFGNRIRRAQVLSAPALAKKVSHLQRVPNTPRCGQPHLSGQAGKEHKLGGGPESSVCPSKPRENNFLVGISGDFGRDIPGLPNKFEKKKFVFNFWPLVYTFGGAWPLVTPIATHQITATPKTPLTLRFHCDFCGKSLRLRNCDWQSLATVIAIAWVTKAWPSLSLLVTLSFFPP